MTGTTVWRIRRFLVILLALFTFIPNPVPEYENTKNESARTSSWSVAESNVKLTLRTNKPNVSSKWFKAALFLVLLFLMQAPPRTLYRISFSRYDLLPAIRLRLRTSLLMPIKFTSQFV